MNFKHLAIISLIFLTLISLSAISASDDVAISDNISTTQEDIGISDDDANILKEDTTTQEDISEEISESVLQRFRSQGTIRLWEKSIKYTGRCKRKFQ